jgi:hypothetical protein
MFSASGGTMGPPNAVAASRRKAAASALAVKRQPKVIFVSGRRGSTAVTSAKQLSSFDTQRSGAGRNVPRRSRRMMRRRGSRPGRNPAADSERAKAMRAWLGLRSAAPPATISANASDRGISAVSGWSCA